MLNINVHEDFISVGAKDEIFKYASTIMPEMGYEDFIKQVVTNSNGFEDILKNFTLDSEYSMFCMYYNHNPKDSKITDEHIKSCTELVLIINNAIRNEYMNAVVKINTSVDIADLRKK